MMSSHADLRERVLAAAASAPSRSRPAARRVALVATVASVALALAVFGWIGGLDHSVGRPRALTWGLAGGWSVVAASVTWLVLGRGGSTLARSPRLLSVAALSTPVACFAWMAVFADRYDEPFARVGYRCLAYTLALAASPLALFLWARRGSEPRQPSAPGAAAGAMAGAWAGVLIDLWCPLTNAPHVLVGHVLPLTLLVAVGALVGARTLGLRALRG
jgi:hypothetical protein